MSPISLAGSGTILVVLEGLAKLLGLNFPDGSIAAGVNGGIALFGFGLLIYGQFRRKDLKYGLIRK